MKTRTNAFGLRIPLTSPDDLMFRWDETAGNFRFITLFTDTGIVGTVSEAEHICEMYVATIRASNETDHNVEEDADWVYKLSEMVAHFAFTKKMTPRAAKVWESLPAEQTKDFDETIAFTFPLTWVRMLVAGDFNHVPMPDDDAYDPMEHALIIAGRQYGMSSDGRTVVKKR